MGQRSFEKKQCHEFCNKHYANVNAGNKFKKFGYKEKALTIVWSLENASAIDLRAFPLLGDSGGLSWNVVWALGP